VGRAKDILRSLVLEKFWISDWPAVISMSRNTRRSANCWIAEPECDGYQLLTVHWEVDAKAPGEAMKFAGHINLTC